MLNDNLNTNDGEKTMQTHIDNLNSIKLGSNVFGSLTGNWLGVVIAIYSEPRNGLTCIRVADDNIDCRNARDIAVTCYVAISPKH